MRIPKSKKWKRRRRNKSVKRWLKVHGEELLLGATQGIGKLGVWQEEDRKGWEAMEVGRGGDPVSLSSEGTATRAAIQHGAEILSR